MTISRRVTALLAAVVTGAGLLAGCGAGSVADPANQNLTAWFMRDSVPQPAQDWLVEKWADTHNGAKLTIETQDWAGIVTKLQTTLASPSQTPDLVEFGNSQVATFTSAGALSDISDLTPTIGGDKLIPSLVSSGSYDGKLYAAPFYAGARIVYYRKSMFEKAGVTVPTTLAQLADTAIALKKANAGVKGFDGIFLPAKDYGASSGWVFTHGARLATLQGTTWKGDLASPQGIAGLTDLKNIYANAMSDAATATLDEAKNPQVPFNEGRAAMFVGLTFSFKKVDPAVQADTGFFALPGLAPGEVGKSFAGGSNLGIPAQSPRQDLARDLMKMTYEPTFQQYFASDGGWVPGNSSYAGALTATPIGKVNVEAVDNSVATPAADKWGVVEGNDVLRDMFTKIAQGGDIPMVAAGTDRTVEGLLNN